MCVCRVLGGLLSAYELSGDEMLLDKAVEIAERLMPAFDTQSGLATGKINLKSGVHGPSWAG